MEGLAIVTSQIQLYNFRFISMSSLTKKCHLGIRPSSNPHSQKASLLYEGVGSIPGVFKYMCV